MTGLNPEKDVILEIATVITDMHLNKIEQGPSFIINRSDTILDAMDEWPRKSHAKNGLTDACQKSTTSQKQAEQDTLNFIKKHCDKGEGLLAGNSVWQDRAFLIKEMPEIIEHLHYRLIDVTAIKELILNWYPSNEHARFLKKDTHRAEEDILESIAELTHYKKHFFI